MTIHSYVEALIKYAEEFLLLDDLDKNYIRERAYSLLKLSSDTEVIDVHVEDLEQMSSPALIFEGIFKYAVEKGVTTVEDGEIFKARFMDCFSKRPSEIQEIFSSLSAKNGGKAITWLYDYNLKNGYVSDYLKRWEAKSTKGKIEVSFLPEKLEKDECRFCHNLEGYGIYSNLRVAPMKLGDEEVYYIPSKYPKYLGQGYLALSEHKPLSLNERTLKLMTDFVDSAPEHFVAFKNCACQKNHGHLVVGDKQLPMMKAGKLTQLKSKEYPYVLIWLVDWYVPVLRMSCSTKDKLIEFVLKTVTSWNLPCGVALKKQDNQYVLDLILIGNKEVSAQNLQLVDGKIDFAGFMGSFALSKSVYEDSLKIEKLLTKELNLKTAGNLDRHSAMIQRLIKEAGTAKLSPIEAALDVKEIINVTLEKALKEYSVFEVGSQELLSLIENKLNIKKHI